MAFTSTPQFFFWLLVLGAQAAVWVVAIGPVGTTVWRRGRSLRSAGVLNATALMSLGLAALLLIGTTLGLILSKITVGGSPRNIPSGDTWPLPDHATRVQPLVGFAVLVGVLAIIGLWLAGAALKEISKDRSAVELEGFVALRNELNMLLAIAGVIIGLGTLASGLLREAVLATNHITLAEQPPASQPSIRISDNPTTSNIDESGYRLDIPFDAQYVALYGLFFTVLLAVAFAPSFLALRAAGRSLRDHALPLPAPTDASFDEVEQRRRSLDDFLQTNLLALASFKAGIAILSPTPPGSLAALLLDLPS